MTLSLEGLERQERQDFLELLHFPGAMEMKNLLLHINASFASRLGGIPTFRTWFLITLAMTHCGPEQHVFKNYRLVRCRLMVL